MQQPKDPLARLLQAQLVLTNLLYYKRYPLRPLHLLCNLCQAPLFVRCPDPSILARNLVKNPYPTDNNLLAYSDNTPTAISQTWWLRSVM